MIPTVDQFMGLGTTGWAAVSALATALTAVLTFGSVTFIALQVWLTRKQQAEGLIERGTSALTSARSDLMDVKASLARKERLPISDAKRVRDIFFAYEIYVPIYELSLREGRSAAASDRSWYIDEMGDLVSVLQHLGSQARSMMSILKGDSTTLLGKVLDSFEVSDDDRVKANELIGESDKSALYDFLDVLKISYYSKKGLTASQISDQRKAIAEKTSNGSDFDFEAFGVLGGDKENALELDAWLDEISSMIERMDRIISRVKSALGAIR